MTHDELLADIDRRIERVNETFYKPNTGALEIRDLMISSLLALRAVVELCAIQDEVTIGDKGIFNSGRNSMRDEIIQAIEGEVK